MMFWQSIRQSRFMESWGARPLRDLRFLLRAPAGYFGLNPLLGLVLSLGALGVFDAIADSATGSATTELTRFDESFATRLHDHARATPLAVAAFRSITAMGSQTILVLLVIGSALVFSWRGQRLLAWAWLISASGGLFHAQLKEMFPRPRPQFADPFVTELSLSFPSGHSMASLIAYGLLAYLLVLVVQRAWIRLAIIVAALLWVCAIGFSRLYLGAHYFSDVAAGYAAGAVWLMLCISAIECVRRRRANSALSLALRPSEI